MASNVEGPHTRGTSLGGVPRKQRMLNRHLPRVIHHQVYQYTKTNMCSISLHQEQLFNTFTEMGMVCSPWEVSQDRAWNIPRARLRTTRRFRRKKSTLRMIFHFLKDFSYPITAGVACLGRSPEVFLGTALESGFERKRERERERERDSDRERERASERESTRTRKRESGRERERAALRGREREKACLPHEVIKVNIIKRTFRGFVWQWCLLFADCPLKRHLRHHSGTNP